MKSATRSALRRKAREHNKKVGAGKRVTGETLEKVYRRGVGAYRTNPSSVRPSVKRSGGEDRWAYARVNVFLRAVKSGRFKRNKKFDVDLLPRGHRLSTKK